MTRRNFLTNTALQALGAALPLSLAARQHTPKQDDTFVINAGIGGNNTQDMLNRLEKDCLSRQPELTVLMAGTNDSMNHDNYIPLEQYKANLTELVQRIGNSGSKVLLMTILPFYTPYLLTRHPASFFANETPDERRIAYNNAIREVAAAQGATLLELGAVFEKIGQAGTDKASLLRNEANSHVKDGVHPTANGYRVIALAVFDCITYKQLPAKRVVCLGDSITMGSGVTEAESYPANLRKLLLQ